MNRILCEDPGAPTVVLTANGHLNSFVTVQILDDTPAVLSLVKTLRRTWIFLGVGQRSKTTVDQPLVVPRLSAISGSNSSSTSTLQDLSSTCPAQERSDELAPGSICGSPQKSKTKLKKGMAIEIRTTVWEMILSGWRSSRIIRRTQ